MDKTTQAATKKYAAFFVGSRRFIEGLADFSEGGKLQGMSLAEFQENFTYVGTFEAKGPDGVFCLLQDGGGGLGVECDRLTGEIVESSKIAGHAMQDLLIGKIGHTSMSKGDVLVDLSNGDVLLCASCGWDKIIVTGMRSPVEA